ncbi:hypothetical protein LOTGIDRAFT_230388 [Lottia gigantea]|uniref:Uncharacterized protein n=1 Tax=Lottia gigantea TaxID=225164 RepID=V4AFV3_LOTGI|nr:hypothetical protein LOTGIDRAFT_230388 [Lottia gigantea]ESP02889.1 hypothetical protein LOTGIDRAFT_230388 [Lottia gigantea]
MAATDSDSMHDSMTRLRMKMVQQKIANERDKLDQRPDTVSTDHDVEHQLKLQHAVFRRQELLDRIRQEQLNRPRTESPRRRFTPSPILLPPPTRRSLPDISRSIVIKDNRGTNNMSQVKHVIEHRGQDSFRPYYLPPIQQPFFPSQIPAAMAPPPQVIQQPAPQVIQQAPPQIIQQAPPIVHAPPPIVQSMPAMPAVHTSPIINHHVEPLHHSHCGSPNKWFNKGDFMDMMMMQNAQMHHMAMQQLMIKSLGGAPGGSERVQHHHYPQTAPAAPQMYHHSLPQMGFGMDMGGYGRGEYY